MVKYVFGLALIFVPIFHSRCKAQTVTPAASSRLSVKISAEERQALVAFYNATGGDHWKNHAGWLGAPGTECSWYGVRCAPTDDSAALFVVDALEFYDNGLEGRIPGSLGGLAHLERLDLIQNKLSGELWSIEIAIQGIASAMEWEKPTTQPKCPGWDDSPERPTK